MSSLHRAHLILRLGLAFVFLYAAYGSFATPDNWIGYIPSYLQAVLPASLLLHGISIAQIICAAWLLSGRALRGAALFATALLVGIIGANWSLMDVIFRDIGLVAASLSLFFLAKEHTT